MVHTSARTGRLCGDSKITKIDLNGLAVLALVFARLRSPKETPNMHLCSLILSLVASPRLSVTHKQISVLLLLVLLSRVPPIPVLLPQANLYAVAASPRLSAAENQSHTPAMSFDVAIGQSEMVFAACELIVPNLQALAEGSGSRTRLNQALEKNTQLLGYIEQQYRSPETVAVAHGASATNIRTSSMFQHSTLLPTGMDAHSLPSYSANHYTLSTIKVLVQQEKVRATVFC